MNSSRQNSSATEAAEVPITLAQNEQLAELYVTQAVWLKRALACRWGQRADDIVQDIFLQIRLKPALLDRMTNPKGWLLRVGQRVGSNQHRSEIRKTQQHQAMQPRCDACDDTEKSCLTDLKRVLVRELKKLTGKRRLVCARRFIKGERFEEIASKTGVAERTIKRCAVIPRNPGHL